MAQSIAFRIIVFLLSLKTIIKAIGAATIRAFGRVA